LALQLTPEEVERYRPYHTIPEFEWGYTDYETGIWSAASPALRRECREPCRWSSLQSDVLLTARTGFLQQQSSIDASDPGAPQYDP
jgi:hypothetical protein